MFDLDKYLKSLEQWFLKDGPQTPRGFQQDHDLLFIFLNNPT